MPKSATIPDDPTEGAIVHVAANGIDEALLKGFVSSIEAEDAKIEEIMAAAEKACQPHRDEIKAIKKKAAENSIDKGPLSAKLRERKLLRRVERVPDSLTEDQRDKFAEISAKLSDMPLFPLFNDADEQEG